MAVGTGNTLIEAESSWFASHAGVTSKELSDQKRAYFSNTIGGIAGESLMEQERRWLRSRTGVTSSELGDMWREAVVGAGKTPSNSLDENKFIYFKTVA